jgi:hypothetical protein
VAAWVQDVVVVLMWVVGAVFVVGVALTIWWGGSAYVPWPLSADARTGDRPGEGGRLSVGTVVLRYLRGVAIAMVGGFWAGVLVTGPGVRLIMRLLAVTAGDQAQGRLTEADEVVGNIDLGGTLSLVLFGGVLTGLLSGAIYVVVRPWLPRGRVGGVIFGALHLVVAGTVIDPLRPDNPDFDLVGPGWLAVTTFSLACVLHGMAVIAYANRYSHTLRPATALSAGAVVPVVLPALVVMLFFVTLIPVALGLALTVVVSRFDRVARIARSRAALITGRVTIGVVAVALLPGTINDLHDVIDRDVTAPAHKPGVVNDARPHDRPESRHMPAGVATVRTLRPPAREVPTPSSRISNTRGDHVSAHRPRSPSHHPCHGANGGTPPG